MIDFDDDLKESLSIDDHGIAFEHKGRLLEGIFNNEYVERDLGDGSVEGLAPVLYAPDLADLVQDDILKLSGKNYKVINNEPDNAGLYVVILHGPL